MKASKNFRSSSLSKFTAAFTAFCFLFTQTTVAAPGLQIAERQEIPSGPALTVPAELASIETLYRHPKSGRFIVQIQNAHTNYGAQIKIREILKYLHKTYGIQTVFVEGAAEKLNPVYLKFFPDEKRNKKLADWFAKEGILDGAGLFIAEEIPGAEGLPIEDIPLYRKNYEALQKVLGAKSEVDRALGQMEARISKAASKTLSPNLKRALAEWQLFEKGSREFLPYIDRLAAEAHEVLGLDLRNAFSQADWPQMARLLALQEIEKKLDLKKALAEKDRLLSFLRSKRISKDFIETVDHSFPVSVGAGLKPAPTIVYRSLLENLITQARPKGFLLKDWPAFTNFAAYLALKQELDAPALVGEIESLFEKLIDALAQTEEEKRIVSLSRDLQLLTKLLHLELSRKEWTELQKRGITPASVGAIHESPLHDLHRSALSFYSLALRRDQMFYEKLDRQMRERGISKAAIVTGGFHTEGLGNILRENGTSFAVLTPHIAEISGPRLYQDVMLHSKAFPFQVSYLGDVAPQQSFMITVRGQTPDTNLPNYWVAGVSDVEGIPAEAAVETINSSPSAAANTIYVQAASHPNDFTIVPASAKSEARKVKEYFSMVKRPVRYKGPDARLLTAKGELAEPAFQDYNPEEVVEVMGKKMKMKDRLRFSAAWWHALKNRGADIFGGPTQDKPWLDGSSERKIEDETARAAFELMDKLGLGYYAFHDRDVAFEGKNPKDSRGKLWRVAKLLKRFQDDYGISLLWGTANLFSHERYRRGAATSHDINVLLRAAGQVKAALEVTHFLGGKNYVLWGGREGYYSQLNTRTKLERDNLAAFMIMVRDHAKEIGFLGEGGKLLIEPKAYEPTMHQYDFDVAAVQGFLKEYGLEKDFALNVEANHATLAGHTFMHELQMAADKKMLWSIDANSGGPKIGLPRVGYDLDLFPGVFEAVEAMLVIIAMGGFPTPGGGVHFDAKMHTTSIGRVNLFQAHILGMDSFAQGFHIARSILRDALYKTILDRLYQSQDSEVAKRLRNNLVPNSLDKLTLKEASAIDDRNPEPTVEQRDAHYEVFERLVQQHMRNAPIEHLVEQARQGEPVAERYFVKLNEQLAQKVKRLVPDNPRFAAKSEARAGIFDADEAWTVIGWGLILISLVGSVREELRPKSDSSVPMVERVTTSRRGDRITNMVPAVVQGTARKSVPPVSKPINVTFTYSKLIPIQGSPNYVAKPYSVPGHPRPRGVEIFDQKNQLVVARISFSLKEGETFKSASLSRDGKTISVLTTTRTHTVDLSDSAKSEARSKGDIRTLRKMLKELEPGTFSIDSDRIRSLAERLVASGEAKKPLQKGVRKLQREFPAPPLANEEERTKQYDAQIKAIWSKLQSVASKDAGAAKLVAIAKDAGIPIRAEAKSEARGNYWQKMGAPIGFSLRSVGVKASKRNQKLWKTWKNITLTPQQSLRIGEKHGEWVHIRMNDNGYTRGKGLSAHLQIIFNPFSGKEVPFKEKSEAYEVRQWMDNGKPEVFSYDPLKVKIKVKKVKRTSPSKDAAVAHILISLNRKLPINTVTRSEARSTSSGQARKEFEGRAERTTRPLRWGGSDLRGRVERGGSASLHPGSRFQKSVHPWTRQPQSLLELLRNASLSQFGIGYTEHQLLGQILFSWFSLLLSLTDSFSQMPGGVKPHTGDDKFRRSSVKGIIQTPPATNAPAGPRSKAPSDPSDLRTRRASPSPARSAARGIMQGKGNRVEVNGGERMRKAGSGVPGISLSDNVVSEQKTSDKESRKGETEQHDWIHGLISFLLGFNNDSRYQEEQKKEYHQQPNLPRGIFEEIRNNAPSERQLGDVRAHSGEPLSFLGSKNTFHTVSRLASVIKGHFMRLFHISQTEVSLFSNWLTPPLLLLGASLTPSPRSEVRANEKAGGLTSPDEEQRTVGNALRIARQQEEDRQLKSHQAWVSAGWDSGVVPLRAKNQKLFWTLAVAAMVGVLSSEQALAGAGRVNVFPPKYQPVHSKAGGRANVPPVPKLQELPPSELRQTIPVPSRPNVKVEEWQVGRGRGQFRMVAVIDNTNPEEVLRKSLGKGETLRGVSSTKSGLLLETTQRQIPVALPTSERKPDGSVYVYREGKLERVVLPNGKVLEGGALSQLLVPPTNQVRPSARSELRHMVVDVSGFDKTSGTEVVELYLTQEQFNSLGATLTEILGLNTAERKGRVEKLFMTAPLSDQDVQIRVTKAQLENIKAYLEEVLYRRENFGDPEKASVVVALSYGAKYKKEEGPSVNAALARQIKDRFYSEQEGKFRVPIFAQWEIADLLFELITEEGAVDPARQKELQIFRLGQIREGFYLNGILVAQLFRNQGEVQKESFTSIGGINASMSAKIFDTVKKLSKKASVDYFENPDQLHNQAARGRLRGVLSTLELPEDERDRTIQGMITNIIGVLSQYKAYREWRGEQPVPVDYQNTFVVAQAWHGTRVIETLENEKYGLGEKNGLKVVGGSFVDQFSPGDSQPWVTNVLRWILKEGQVYVPSTALPTKAKSEARMLRVVKGNFSNAGLAGVLALGLGAILLVHRLDQKSAPEKPAVVQPTAQRGRGNNVGYLTWKENPPAAVRAQQHVLSGPLQSQNPPAGVRAQQHVNFRPSPATNAPAGPRSKAPSDPSDLRTRRASPSPARSDARIGKMIPDHLPRGYESSSNLMTQGGNLMLAYSESAKTLIRWDARQQRGLQIFKMPFKKLEKLAVNWDRDLLATLANDGRLFLWDLQTEKPLFEKKVGKDARRADNLEISPDGKYLVYSQKDSYTVTLWDAEEGHLVMEIWPSRSFKPFQVAFSPEGKWMAVGSDSGDIHLHDPANPQNRPVSLKAKGQRDVITELAFSPDGKHLAVAQAESDVFIWDLQDFKVADRLKPKSSVYHVVFSPNGRHLALDYWFSGTSVWHWSGQSWKQKHPTDNVRYSGYGLGGTFFSSDSRTLYKDVIRTIDKISGKLVLWKESYARPATKKAAKRSEARSDTQDSIQRLRDKNGVLWQGRERALANDRAIGLPYSREAHEFELQIEENLNKIAALQGTSRDQRFRPFRRSEARATATKLMSSLLQKQKRIQNYADAIFHREPSEPIPSAAMIETFVQSADKIELESSRNDQLTFLVEAQGVNQTYVLKIQTYRLPAQADAHDVTLQVYPNPEGTEFWTYEAKRTPAAGGRFPLEPIDSPAAPYLMQIYKKLTERRSEARMVEPDTLKEKYGNDFRNFVSENSKMGDTVGRVKKVLEEQDIHRSAQILGMGEGWGKLALNKVKVVITNTRWEEPLDQLLNEGEFKLSASEDVPLAGGDQSLKKWSITFTHRSWGDREIPIARPEIGTGDPVKIPPAKHNLDEWGLAAVLVNLRSTSPASRSEARVKEWAFIFGIAGLAVFGLLNIPDTKSEKSAAAQQGVQRGRGRVSAPPVARPVRPQSPGARRNVLPPSKPVTVTFDYDRKSIPVQGSSDYVVRKWSTSGKPRPRGVEIFDQKNQLVVARISFSLKEGETFKSASLSRDGKTISVLTTTRTHTVDLSDSAKSEARSKGDIQTLRKMLKELEPGTFSIDSDRIRSLAEGLVKSGEAKKPLQKGVRKLQREFPAPPLANEEERTKQYGAQIKAIWSKLQSFASRDAGAAKLVAIAKDAGIPIRAEAKSEARDTATAVQKEPGVVDFELLKGTGHRWSVGLNFSTQGVQAVLVSHDSGNRGGIKPFEESYRDPKYADKYKSPDGHDEELNKQNPDLFVVNPLMAVEAWFNIHSSIQEYCRQKGLKMSNIKSIGPAGMQHALVGLTKEAAKGFDPDSDKSPAEQMREGGYLSVLMTRIWKNKDTGKVAKALTDRFGGVEKAIFETGSPIEKRFALAAAAQILEVQQTEYDKTDSFLTWPSFIEYLATGNHRASWSPGEAAASNLVDPRNPLKWRNNIDELVRGLRAKLPDIEPTTRVAGKVSRYMVKKFGYSPNVKVNVGEGDNPADQIGLALFEGDRSGASFGTSGVLTLGIPNRAAFEVAVTTSKIGSTMVKAFRNQLFKLLCFQNSGTAIRKMRDERLPADEVKKKLADRGVTTDNEPGSKEYEAEAWKIFTEEVQAVQAGNNGGMMIMMDTDEEVIPIRHRPGQPYVKNLDLNTSTRGQIWRAGIEGQVYLLKEAARRGGIEVKAINFTGGEARNPAIVQAMADIFNVPVYVLKKIPGGEINSVAFGAAISAAKAAYDDSHKKPMSWRKATEGLVIFEDQPTMPKNSDAYDFPAFQGLITEAEEKTKALLAEAAEIEGHLKNGRMTEADQAVDALFTSDIEMAMALLSRASGQNVSEYVMERLGLPGIAGQIKADDLLQLLAAARRNPNALFHAKADAVWKMVAQGTDFVPFNTTGMEIIEVENLGNLVPGVTWIQDTAFIQTVREKGILVPTGKNLNTTTFFEQHVSADAPYGTTQTFLVVEESMIFPVSVGPGPENKIYRVRVKKDQAIQIKGGPGAVNHIGLAEEPGAKARIYNGRPDNPQVLLSNMKTDHVTVYTAIGDVVRAPAPRSESRSLVRLVDGQLIDLLFVLELKPGSADEGLLHALIGKVQSDETKSLLQELFENKPPKEREALKSKFLNLFSSDENLAKVQAMVADAQALGWDISVLLNQRETAAKILESLKAAALEDASRTVDRMLVPENMAAAKFLLSADANPKVREFVMERLALPAVVRQLGPEGLTQRLENLKQLLAVAESNSDKLLTAKAAAVRDMAEKLDSAVDFKAMGFPKRIIQGKNLKKNRVPGVRWIKKPWNKGKEVPVGANLPTATLLEIHPGTTQIFTVKAGVMYFPVTLQPGDDIVLVQVNAGESFEIGAGVLHIGLPGGPDAVALIHNGKPGSSEVPLDKPEDHITNYVAAGSVVNPFLLRRSEARNEISEIRHLIAPKSEARIAVVREDIANDFPQLLGDKEVNGRTMKLEEVLGEFSEIFGDEFADVQIERREKQEDAAEDFRNGKPLEEIFGFGDKNKVHKDVDGVRRTRSQIRQGMSDNFLGRKTKLAWRLNPTEPVPEALRRRGLEGTGPATDLGMAITAINAGAKGAVQWMFDWEDAMRGAGKGAFQAWDNILRILSGEFENGRTYHHPAKDKDYTIEIPQDQRPTLMFRVPGLHLKYDTITVNGKQIPAMLAALVITALNYYDLLKKTGQGLYFYVPKIESPREAALLAVILDRLEKRLGLNRGTLKIKMLNERAEYSLNQDVVMWHLRHWLVGANVGRWDYSNSRQDLFQESTKMMFPDLFKVGMLDPTFMEYTDMNGLMVLLVSVDDNGEMTHGYAIGGMAAQLRNRPLGTDQPEIAEQKAANSKMAEYAIFRDKLRERLAGLWKYKDRFYDVYWQSWVATPDPDYVAAGSKPLQPLPPDPDLDNRLAPLQALVSDLHPDDQKKFRDLGLLDENNKIRIREITEENLSEDYLFSKEKWHARFDPPKGERTEKGLWWEIYMISDYIYQYLSGKDAAPIEDPFEGNGLAGVLAGNFTGGRLMSDHATNEGNARGVINSVRHGAVLTQDGETTKAGNRITPELFMKLWTKRWRDVVKLFKRLEKEGKKPDWDLARLDMAILKNLVVTKNPDGKLIPQPMRIKYVSKILYLMINAKDSKEQWALLDAIFKDRTKLADDLKKAVASEQLGQIITAQKALEAHDYVHDTVPPYEMRMYQFRQRLSYLSERIDNEMHKIDFAPAAGEQRTKIVREASSGITGLREQGNAVIAEMQVLEKFWTQADTAAKDEMSQLLEPLNKNQRELQRLKDREWDLMGVEREADDEAFLARIHQLDQIRARMHELGGAAQKLTEPVKLLIQESQAEFRSEARASAERVKTILQTAIELVEWNAYEENATNKDANPENVLLALSFLAEGKSLQWLNAADRFKTTDNLNLLVALGLRAMLEKVHEGTVEEDIPKFQGLIHPLFAQSKIDVFKIEQTMINRRLQAAFLVRFQDFMRNAQDHKVVVFVDDVDVDDRANNFLKVFQSKYRNLEIVRIPSAEAKREEWKSRWIEERTQGKVIADAGSLVFFNSAQISMEFAGGLDNLKVLNHIDINHRDPNHQKILDFLTALRSWRQFFIRSEARAKPKTKSSSKSNAVKADEKPSHNAAELQQTFQEWVDYLNGRIDGWKRKRSLLETQLREIEKAKPDPKHSHHSSIRAIGERIDEIRARIDALKKFRDTDSTDEGKAALDKFLLESLDVTKKLDPLNAQENQELERGEKEEEKEDQFLARIKRLDVLRGEIHPLRNKQQDLDRQISDVLANDKYKKRSEARMKGDGETDFAVSTFELLSHPNLAAVVAGVGTREKLRPGEVELQGDGAEQRIFDRGVLRIVTFSDAEGVSTVGVQIEFDETSRQQKSMSAVPDILQVSKEGYTLTARLLSFAVEAKKARFHVSLTLTVPTGTDESKLTEHHAVRIHKISYTPGNPRNSKVELDAIETGKYGFLPGTYFQGDRVRFPDPHTSFVDAVVAGISETKVTLVVNPSKVEVAASEARGNLPGALNVMAFHLEPSNKAADLEPVLRVELGKPVVLGTNGDQRYYSIPVKHKSLGTLADFLSDEPKAKRLKGFRQDGKFAPLALAIGKPSNVVALLFIKTKGNTHQQWLLPLTSAENLFSVAQGFAYFLRNRYKPFSRVAMTTRHSSVVDLRKQFSSRLAPGRVLTFSPRSEARMKSTTKGESASPENPLRNKEAVRISAATQNSGELTEVQVESFGAAGERVGTVGPQEIGQGTNLLSAAGTPVRILRQGDGSLSVTIPRKKAPARKDEPSRSELRLQNLTQTYTANHLPVVAQVSEASLSAEALMALAIGILPPGATLAEIQNWIDEVQEALLQRGELLQALQNLEDLLDQNDGGDPLLSLLKPTDAPGGAVITELPSPKEFAQIVFHHIANIGVRTAIVAEGVSKDQLKALAEPYLEVKDLAGNPIFDRLMLAGVKKGDLAAAVTRHTSDMAKVLGMSPQDIVVLLEGGQFAAFNPDKSLGTRVKSDLQGDRRLVPARDYLTLLLATHDWQTLNRQVPDAFQPRPGFLEMNRAALPGLSVQVAQLFARKKVSVSA